MLQAQGARLEAPEPRRDRHFIGDRGPPTNTQGRKRPNGPYKVDADEATPSHISQDQSIKV